MLPDREGLGWLRWVLQAAGISSCQKSSGDMTKCMGKEPGNPEGLQLMAEALQCALGAWLGSIPALGGACSRQGPVWCGWGQPRALLCLLEPLHWGRGCGGSSQLLKPSGRTKVSAGGWPEQTLPKGMSAAWLPRLLGSMELASCLLTHPAWQHPELAPWGDTRWRWRGSSKPWIPTSALPCASIVAAERARLGSRSG